MRLPFISLFVFVTLRSNHVTPIDILVPNIADPGCNEGGYRFADDCYILYTEEKLSFHEANSTCNANKATLSNERDNSTINKLQKQLLLDYWVESTRPVDSSPNNTSTCGNINNCTIIKLSFFGKGPNTACNDCKAEFPYICQFTSGNITNYNKSSDVQSYVGAVEECHSQGGSLAKAGKELDEFLQNDLAIWIGTEITINSTFFNQTRNETSNYTAESKCLATNVFSLNYMTIDCNSKHFFVCKEPAFIPNITHAAIHRVKHQAAKSMNPILLATIITTVAIGGLLVTIIIIRQLGNGSSNGYQWLPYFENPGEDQDTLMEYKSEDDEILFP